TTRPGDLWILGNHRLLCGDSGKTGDVDRLLAGAPIHFADCDSPYNTRTCCGVDIQTLRTTRQPSRQVDCISVSALSGSKNIVFSLAKILWEIMSGRSMNGRPGPRTFSSDQRTCQMSGQSR